MKDKAWKWLGTIGMYYVIYSTSSSIHGWASLFRPHEGKYLQVPNCEGGGEWGGGGGEGGGAKLGVILFLQRFLAPILCPRLGLRTLGSYADNKYCRGWFIDRRLTPSQPNTAHTHTHTHTHTHNTHIVCTVRVTVAGRGRGEEQWKKLFLSEWVGGFTAQLQGSDFCGMEPKLFWLSTPATTVSEINPLCCF